ADVHEQVRGQFLVALDEHRQPADQLAGHIGQLGRIRLLDGLFGRQRRGQVLLSNRDAHCGGSHVTEDTFSRDPTGSVPRSPLGPTSLKPVASRRASWLTVSSVSALTLTSPEHGSTFTVMSPSLRSKVPSSCSSKPRFFSSSFRSVAMSSGGRISRISSWVAIS